MITERELYYKLVGQLRLPNPNIQNLLNLHQPQPLQQQFNIFVLDFLAKYIQGYQFLKEIKSSLITEQHRKSFSLDYSQLPERIKQITEDNALSKVFDQLRGMDKRLKQLNKQTAVLQNLQFSLLELKYFEFESYERTIDSKINKLVDVVNVYQSFLISTSRQKGITKLEGNQVVAHDFYSSNSYKTKKSSLMEKIQSNQNQYYQALQILNHLFPQISVEYRLQQKLTTIFKSFEKLKKEIETSKQQKEAVKLILQQLLASLQQKKQPPSNWHSAIQFVTTQTYNLLNQLRSSISLLLSQARHGNQQKGKAQIFYYLNPMTYLRMSYGVTYNELQDFVSKIYNTLQRPDGFATLQQKMRVISSRVEKTGYSNQLIEEVTNFQPLLNQVVKQVLKHFKINQLSSPKQHNIIYQFTLEDILQLKNKIQQSDSLNTPQNEYIEQVKSRMIQGFQVMQLQKPKTYQIPKMEQSLDLIKQLRLNNQSLESKQAHIKELQQRNNTNQSQLAKLKANQSQFLRKLASLESQILSKNKQIECIKDLNQQQALKTALDAYQKQIATFQEENKVLKQQTQAYFHDKISLVHQIQIQRQKHQHQLNTVKAKNEEQLRNAKQIWSNNNRKSLQLASQKHQAENNKLKAQFDSLKQQYQAFTANYYQQIQEKLNQSILKVQRSVKESRFVQANTSCILQRSQNLSVEAGLDEIVKLQKQSSKKYEDQITDLKLKQEKLQQQINSLISQYRNIQNQCSLKDKQYIKLKQQYQNLEETNSNLQKQIKAQSKDIEALKATIKQLEESIKVTSQLAERNLDIRAEVQQQSQIPTNLPKLVHYTRYLFNQDIFYESEDEKKKLVNHIQWYARSKIIRTQLLYKYDTINKANFHQYIDEAPGLLLVVKTKNAIVAGFYPGALRDKEILNKGGLLISVTNDNSYLLYNKKPGDNKTIYRGMIYDTFFAIYGNAEIRVKSGFKTVFSNFGVSNSYYNSRGDRIDKFFNEGEKREVPFEYCEFYKVSFERENLNYR